MTPTNETNNKPKRKTKQALIVDLLEANDLPKGEWMSRNYLMRAVWPELWRKDPIKCRRNLSCQLTYLRRRGIVTEIRKDSEDDTGVKHVYIRLAPAEAPE